MWECNELLPAVGSRSDIQNVWTWLIFFAPSSLAVAALLVQYLVLHTPFARSAWDVNPVDVVVLKWIRNALGYLGLSFRYLDQPRRDNGWRVVFDQFMLTLSDVHAGFGIAIVGYGFASLPRGFTAYEWWLMVGLAWAAVITNIAVLSCLRDLFHKSPAKRDWRLCFVFAMLAILAFCMVPIERMRHALFSHRQASTHDILDANVLCFFPGRGHASASGELSQFILSWGIIAGFVAIMTALAIVVMILERPNSILRRWCDHHRGEMLDSSSEDQLLCPRCEHRFILLVRRPFIAFWLVLRTHLDLLNSVLVEITCTVALLLWTSLRFWELLRLQPLQSPENLITFVHFIALVTLLAPFKPVVEHLCVICRNYQGLASVRNWARPQKPESGYLPISQGNKETLINKVESGPSGSGVPKVSGEVRVSPGQTSSRRRTGSTLPMHFKFYLDTAWYVKALLVAAVSALVQLFLLFVLPTVGGKPVVDVVLKLSPWYGVFAPVLVLLFILSAIFTEERGGSSEEKQLAYWGLSALFGVVSIAAALDTIYGLGGYPMSYVGMATLGMMVITYALYGCVSKPGRLVKGKGTNSGQVDEESALLGSKVQVKIPVRRQKHLHGPSRRLSKQRIKNYGTIVKPGN